MTQVVCTGLFSTLKLSLARVVFMELEPVHLDCIFNFSLCGHWGNRRGKQEFSKQNSVCKGVVFSYKTKAVTSWKFTQGIHDIHINLSTEKYDNNILSNNITY